jgi:hypothetical protein
MQDKNIENYRQTLEVSPFASKAEINEDFEIAIKQQKSPVETIAEARESLTNPEEQIIADYLNPVIPIVKYIRSSDINDRDLTEDTVEAESSCNQIDQLIQTEIDKLEADSLEQDSDLELANLVWE